MRFVQTSSYLGTANTISLLFGWHKNFGGVKSGIIFCHEEKLVTGETNSELKRIFNSY